MELHRKVTIDKYEGTEKLLEIWFTYDDGSFENERPDLKNLSRYQIQHILDLARCEIVKEMHTKNQLSFVLSESSLFITADRLILKTCGTTLLLNALAFLLNVAYEFGFSNHVIYYSRGSFLFPELQCAPHLDFNTEIKHIENFCHSGSGFTLGRVNKYCWHFYWGQSVGRDVNEPVGQTIELMMRGLNLENMKLFYADAARSSEEATHKSGISSLFPKCRISSFLFKPCGYSANGLMETNEYFTIHVTPEPEFSYASFETNATLPFYSQLIHRVLDIFGPEAFICNFYAETGASMYAAHAELEKMTKLAGYKRNNLQTAVMDNGRKLTFAEFNR